jgi:small subunit ribosomal protein S5e
MAEVAEPIVDTTPAAAPEEEQDDEQVEVDELALVEELEDYVAVGGATEIKLFGKWAFDDIEVRDISLVVRFNLMG